MDKVRELAALREEKGLDFDIEVDVELMTSISQAKARGQCLCSRLLCL